MDKATVAIVGAGIGGSALAVSLARAGIRVVLLEKTLQHKDVVRGEWLAPWGVEEANALQLTDLYLARGAHRVNRHISYSDLVDRQTAEANTMDLTTVVPQRPLCLGHPATCNLLNKEAQRLGVDFRRGVQALQVTPGLPPTLSFVHDG